jgi:non-ribosomal peptide synthetase component F
MLARVKSEIAYVGGILRALRRTRPIAENRSLTLGDYLEGWAKIFGAKAALLSETETLTYRALDARANRYARWARAQGLGKGDAICLMDGQPSRIRRDLARHGGPCRFGVRQTGPRFAAKHSENCH